MSSQGAALTLLKWVTKVLTKSEKATMIDIIALIIIHRRRNRLDF